MNLARRFFIGVLAWFLCQALAGPALAEESARLGMYMNIARDLNRSDARAVLELWAEELTKKFGVPSQVFFYGDMESLRRDFESGRINMVVADAMSFVRHFKADDLAEGFTTRLQHDASLLLLARDGKRELAGRRVARVENDDISSTYLEVLCMRLHNRACADAQVRIVPVANNHQAVARLLFGQTDLALVNRHGLLLATELNPQLGRVGQMVSELNFDTQYFGFFSSRVDPAFRAHALRSLPMTHQEARGKQLLEVFRVERVVLADPGVLKPFYSLEKDYRDLRARTVRPEGRR